MSALSDMLLSQLDGSAFSALSQTLGADGDATKKATAMALPMLMSALAKNAGSADGAAALDRALEKDHDGSVLEDLAQGLTRGSEGAGILKHVLGGRQSQVASGIAAASGLDSNQSGNLLASLAPLVMGALGKQKRSQGLDAGALASMLSQEGGAAKSQLGGLAGLLDQDGDGSIADDVLGGLAKGLGGKLFGKG